MKFFSLPFRPTGWLLLLVVLTVLSSCGSSPVTGPGRPADIPTPTPARVPVLVTAHRGGANLAPENTLAAFRKGIEVGADVIELDLHLSKDGELIVSHDADVSRTSDGTGRIRTLTLAEIKRFNAAARFPGGWPQPETFPTLREVIELAKGKVDMELEIKVPTDGRYPGIEAKVAQLCQETGITDHVVVISFDRDTLRAVKAADARLHTGFLVSATTVPLEGRASPQALVNLAIAAGASALGVSRDYLKPEIVQAAHTAGLKVSVWTVDDPAEMRQYIQMGVDRITSNRPDLLRAEVGTR